MSEEELQAAPPPKVDPETLVLRAAPRRVVRFRRGLIIGISGAVAATLATLAWVALEPPSFRMAAGQGERNAPAKAAPDALAGAPADYGDVPQLGPPLPGDLGRPILEHQRSLEGDGVVPVPTAATSEAEAARAAAEAERQREIAAADTARGSDVIVQLQGRGGGRTEEPASAPAGSATSETETPRSPIAEPAAQRGRLGRSAEADVSPHALRASPSPWTLSAGTIIPASLVTGLNSDLPGIVIAQVTQHVRDSATGRTILVPQGARLMGSYDNVVAFGQRRALLVWQRIVFPDGSSVRLGDAPATDPAGYAGVEDGVDFHTWRLLKGIALSTLLGVGTELTVEGESDLVRAIREATQQNTARAGDRLTSRNLDVQPTLTVRPGWPLRAVIHQDLVLRPWRG